MSFDVHGRFNVGVQYHLRTFFLMKLDYDASSCSTGAALCFIDPHSWSELFPHADYCICMLLLSVCSLRGLLSRATVEQGGAATPPVPLASPPHTHHLHNECSNTFQGCLVGEILRRSAWDSWMQQAVVTGFSSSLPTHSHSFCLLGASDTKTKSWESAPTHRLSLGLLTGSLLVPGILQQILGHSQPSL